MTADRTLASRGLIRMFTWQPERLAAAWRRLRFEQLGRKEEPVNLIDNVVEPLVREIGRTLAGARGAPWSRCSGVLLLSPERGARALSDELAGLRRCLLDAIEVIDPGPSGESARLIVNWSIDDAIESSIALYEQLLDPSAPPSRIPFGGLVLELYERASSSARPAREGVDHATLH